MKMKTNKILAMIVAIVMILTCFASCRTKDENAFVITYQGETVEIKTALYMCFLIDADQTFQTEAVKKAEADKVEYKDYQELKYEDKDYDTWVKDKAAQSAKEFAYYEVEQKRLGLDFTEEEVSYIESEAENYWEGSEGYAGYSEVYEANGISLDTFKKYYLATYKASAIYNFYVEEVEEEHDHDHDHEETTANSSSGTVSSASTTTTTTVATTTTVPTTTEKKLSPEIEKLHGSLRPSDKDINTTIEKNFVAIDKIEISFTDDNGEELDEKTKASHLKTLNTYAKELKNGAKFDEVYSDYQQTFGTSTEDSSSTGSDYSTVLSSSKGNESAGYDAEADEGFEEAYKLKAGEVKVIENEDNYQLVMKKDILKATDENGTALKDSYINTAINILVEDTFNTDYVEKGCKEMKVKTNDSAIKFYSPKKIDYLQDETTTTVAY